MLEPREILFQARSRDSKERPWVTGYYAKIPIITSFCDCIYPMAPDGVGVLSPVMIDRDTLRQFTGQYGREHTRIWEFDIVIHSDYNFPLVVVWNDGEFDLHANDTFYDRLDHYTAAACTVIGNVFDNPELLR